MLIPLMRKLAEKGELDIVSRPFGAPLFEGQSFIAKTFPLPHPNRGKKGLAKLLFGKHREHLADELKLRNYDEIYYFDAERKVITDWVESWRGDAQVRVLVTPVSTPDWLSVGMQETGWNLAGFEPFPRLEVSDKNRRQAQKKLQEIGDRVVAVQVGTGPVNVKWRKPYNIKGLSPEQWGGIITHILENKDVDAVVFHGTPNEAQFISPIMQQIPAKFHQNIHNWTTDVGIHKLKSLLSAHYAMISVDTGPAHIAAAVGCPLLTFFGPTPPEKYLMQGSEPVEMVLGSVSCMPCQHTRNFKKCRDNICLNQLTKKQLTAGWDRLIKRTKYKK